MPEKDGTVEQGGGYRVAGGRVPAAAVTVDVWVGATLDAIAILGRARCLSADPVWTWLYHCTKRLEGELNRWRTVNPEEREAAERAAAGCLADDGDGERCSLGAGHVGPHRAVVGLEAGRLVEVRATVPAAPLMGAQFAVAPVRVTFEDDPPAARVRPIVREERALVEALAPLGPSGSVGCCHEQRDGFSCTRITGHDGAHVAHGSLARPVALWPAVAGKER